MGEEHRSISLAGSPPQLDGMEAPQTGRLDRITLTSGPMSSSSSSSKAGNPSLSLEDILHDLAVMRAVDIDLSAIFASTMPGGPILTTTTPAVDVDVDASVARSHEFAQAARTAIKMKNRGDVEAQGERVNNVRGQLEEVVEGLVGCSIPERTV